MNNESDRMWNEAIMAYLRY